MIWMSMQWQIRYLAIRNLLGGCYTPEEKEYNNIQGKDKVLKENSQVLRDTVKECKGINSY